MRAWLALLLIAPLPLAVAQAEDPVEVDPPWPTLSIPEPLPGDAAVYERTILRVTDGRSTVLEPGLIRDKVEVQETGHLWDGWGLARPAIRFLAHMEGQPVPVRYDVDAATGDAFAWTRFTGGSGAEDGAQFSWTTARTDMRDAPPEPPLCGVEHALQGHAGPAPMDIVLFRDDCRRAYWHASPASEWRIDRVDGTGDERWVAYRQTNAGRDALVWLRDGVPFPIRFMENYRDDEWAVLDLVAFQRGSGRPSPAVEDLPPLDLRAIERFDPGPMPTPWSLQEAVAAARDDATVAAWLEDHPDAFLRSSWYNDHLHTERTDAGTRTSQTWGWYLRFDDATEAIKVDVEKLHTREVVEGPMGPVPLPTTTAIDVSVKDEGSYGVRWDEVAHVLPTPESIVSRWEAFAAPESVMRGANAYGHDLYCSPCLVPRGYSSVGLLESEGRDDVRILGGGQATWNWTGSYLMVENTGIVTSVVENRMEAQVERVVWQSLPPFPVPVPTPLESIVEDLLGGRSPGIPMEVGLLREQPSPSRAPDETEPLSTVVDAPEPAVSSQAWLVGGAIAGGALGLGALWKVFGAALFSRITQDRALRHPVRNLMHDVIVQQPGIHLMELVRRTGVSQGTARHHVSKLVQTGLVEVRRSAAGVSYFPPGLGSDERRRLAAARSSGARRVLEASRRDPHANAAQLAKTTGLSVRTVRYHLQRLRAQGVL